MLLSLVTLKEQTRQRLKFCYLDRRYFWFRDARDFSILPLRIYSASVNILIITPGQTGSMHIVAVSRFEQDMLLEIIVRQGSGSWAERKKNGGQDRPPASLLLQEEKLRF